MNLKGNVPTSIFFNFCHKLLNFLNQNYIDDLFCHFSKRGLCEDDIAFTTLSGMLVSNNF